MHTQRDNSLGHLIDGLNAYQKKLFKQIVHYDEQGVLEWWIDQLPPSKKRHCRVLVEMILSDIAEIEYKDLQGSLEYGGYRLLKEAGIHN